jgi:hypothetical protein
VSGDTRAGATLTADHGSWSGTQPIDYAYRWQRCDADGTGCADVPGETGSTYALTADDVGHTVRVVVTATNADGTAEAASAASGPVEAATPSAPAQPPTETTATPAPPATGAAGPPTDLSALPGSLVGDRACQQIVGTLAPQRAAVAGVGTVIVRVRADSVVAPDAPVRVTVTAPRGRTVRAALTLDGRRVRLAGRNPRAGALTPTALGGAGTHVLRVRLRARTTKARVVQRRLRTAACAMRLTARGRAVGAASALTLRVDSRAPVARVAFSVPSAVALRARAQARAAGRIRYVVAGGKSRTLRLTLPAGKRSGVLLDAKGGPRVTFSARSVVVAALPTGTGIVELTLAEPGRAALRALRLRARVTGAGRSSVLTVRTQKR